MKAIALVTILIFLPLNSFAEDHLCKFLKTQIQSGDLVFTGISNPAMQAVSEATSSWANHLGIVFETDDGWRVFESILLNTGDRSFCDFLKRAKTGEVAVLRLKEPLNEIELKSLWQTLQSKLGARYDASFNLKSRGQYCSKLVYQVFKEALGIEVGTVESFRDVYQQAGKKGRQIFKLWFWKGIPWDRLTVTPKSQLQDPQLKTVWSWQNL